VNPAVIDTPHLDSDGVGHIPLRNNQGEVNAWALVDEVDFERIAAHRWFYADGGAYRNRSPKGPGLIGMHRMVLDLTQPGPRGGPRVHHKNKNGLDNRRANLTLNSGWIRSVAESGALDDTLLRMAREQTKP
jgi:hypothetical protein